MSGPHALTWAALLPLLLAACTEPRVSGGIDSLTAGGDWLNRLPDGWAHLDLGVAGEESWWAALALEGANLQGTTHWVVLGQTNGVRKPLGTWDPEHPLAGGKTVAYTLERQVAALLALVELGEQQGAVPILAVAPPIYQDASGWQDPADLDEWNARIASEGLAARVLLALSGSSAVVVDLHAAFLAECPNWQVPCHLFERPDGTNDGVHPWAAGRQLMAEVITGAVVGSYLP